MSSIIVSLLRPESVRFFAVSIPKPLRPYNKTLAYDYLFTASKPITPM